MVLRRPVESAQYLVMNYTQRLAEADLVPSVGSVGDSYDNALAETINGFYKAEVIWRQRSWPTAAAVEMATLKWVDWFNNHRLFGPIGHIPPAEAEANYYAEIGSTNQELDSKPGAIHGDALRTRCRSLRGARKRLSGTHASRTHLQTVHDFMG